MVKTGHNWWWDWSQQINLSINLVGGKRKLVFYLAMVLVLG